VLPLHHGSVLIRTANLRQISESVKSNNRLFVKFYESILKTDGFHKI